MSARFRIRTAQGQELSFGSEEMFADFVRSGELSPDDLVYDADTGEWCSALTHSLVLEWEAERQAPENATPASGDIVFDLSPAQSPEEEAAAFVEKMKAERASEFDHIESVRGLDIDDGSTNLLTGIPEGSTASPERSASRSSPAPAAPPAGSGPPASRSPARQQRQEVKPSRTKPTRRAARGRAGPGVSRSFLVWVIAFGVVGAGVLLGSDIAAVALGIGDAEFLGAADSPPVLPDTEEALRDRAAVRFLAQAREELGSLPVIPSIWLDGRYLADASEYPEVRQAWTAYRNAIEEVRSDEVQLYRRAYLSALDDARVTGATRTLRLASAASSFEAGAPTRAAHYDRVAELAAAALDLHDLLVERDEDITYEPAVGSRVSADPVLQAAASDPDLQAELEASLDRVLDALSAQGMGPVDARAVPPWAFQGLREIVDPE